MTEEDDSEKRMWSSCCGKLWDAAVATGVSIPVAGQVALGIVGLIGGIYGLTRILYPS